MPWKPAANSGSSTGFSVEGLSHTCVKEGERGGVGGVGGADPTGEPEPACTIHHAVPSMPSETGPHLAQQGQVDVLLVKEPHSGPPRGQLCVGSSGGCAAVGLHTCVAS